MRALLLTATVLASGFAHAQGAPVTVAEANAALDRIEAAIRRVLKMPASRGQSERANRPVTRAEVITRLDAMFESFKPHFKLTPRPHRTEPEVAKRFNKDAATLDRIEKLARYGCIGPVGPIVVGPGDTIGVAELGDAMGLFLSQIAALTYTADPKWTPALMPPDGGGA